MEEDRLFFAGYSGIGIKGGGNREGTFQSIENNQDKKEFSPMKMIKLPRQLLNPTALPGMGRSMELYHLEAPQRAAINDAFSRKELYIEFEDEDGTAYPVINLWADPHDPSRLTLFIE